MLYHPDRAFNLKHPEAGEYFFFYDWEAAYEAASLTRARLKRAVAERLHRHRNLCEDFVDVCELEPEEIGLCADIELAPGADAEQVAAEINYRLHNHVSPAPRFLAIEQLLARGRSVDQVFEGARLDHGCACEAAEMFVAQGIHRHEAGQQLGIG